MSKKVKFASAHEESKFYEEFDTEITEGNDLDLDTIRARSKSRGIKNIDEAEEESEDEIETGTAMKWDEDADELELPSEDEDGDEVKVPSEVEIQSEEDDKSIPLEPFSIKADREEGSFDTEGFFVRAVDEDADQDRWLSNLTKSDISKARRAHEKIEAERKAALQGREEEAGKISSLEAYRQLLQLMKPGQTVLAAIRSKTKQNTQTSNAPRPPLNKNRLKKLAANQNNPSSDQPMSDQDQLKELNRITELADLLMNRGNYNIYEEAFEEISLKFP